MPLNLQAGVTIPIPCRPCGLAFIPFKVEAGTHRLTCPRCGGVTIATVSPDAEENWRIRTEGVGVPAAGRKVPARG